MEPFWTDDIPEIGYIEDGVACGFLCQTDSSICFIEGFISNPKANAKSVNRAIWDIAYAVLATAKDIGYKRCLLLSAKSGILKRGERLGFEPFETNVMAKQLV